MTDRELMQQALDALEKLNKDGWILADFEDEVYASIEALRARLAQPELGVTLTAAKHPVSLSKPSEHKLSKESLEDVVLERKWQGLTDEEVRDLWSWAMAAEAERTANTQQHAFARAIEAKLKEKNT